MDRIEEKVCLQVCNVIVKLQKSMNANKILWMQMISTGFCLFNEHCRSMCESFGMLGYVDLFSVDLLVL